MIVRLLPRFLLASGPVVLVLALVPVALADNCSSPGDCEATADYNFGIAIGGGTVSVIVGTIASLTANPPPAGGGGTTTTMTGRGGGGPLVDPYDGGPLVPWDPSRGAGGKPGDVWWPWGGGRWVPPDEAHRLVEEGQRERQREDDYNQKKWEENKQWSEEGTRQRHDQLEKEAQQEHERLVKERQDEIDRIKREKLRDILADQQKINKQISDDENSWTGWGRNFTDEFLGGVKKDILSVPGDLQQVGHELINGGTRLINNTIDGLKDPENWRILGETIKGTVTDPFKMAMGDPGAWDRAVNGFDDTTRVIKTVGEIGKNIAKKVVEDPIGFIKEITPIKTWEESVDGNRTLVGRIGKVIQATIDTALILEGVGKNLGKGVVEGGGHVLERDALEEAAGGAKKVLEDGHLPKNVDPRKLDELNDAWRNRLNTSNKHVDEYTNAGKKFDEAIKSGDPDLIKQATQARKDAAIKLQGDKMSIQELNRRDADTIAKFKNDMQRVYDDTDKRMVDWAKDNGHIGRDAQRVPGTDPGTQIYRDGSGRELHIKEPTNPPKVGEKIKAGADRDYTIYTKDGANAPLKDIPSGEVKDAYHQNFFESAGGKDTAEKLGLPTDPDKFAKKMDQSVTDKLHPEAYGGKQKDLDIATAKKGDALAGGEYSDSAQVGQAVGYKGQHWFQEGGLGPGAKITGGTPQEVAKQMEHYTEGSRQLTKQFNNQAVNRYEAISQQAEALKAQGKLPASFEVKPPPQELTDAVNILKKVDGTPGGLSPMQANEQLAKLGLTPDDVAGKLGSYVDGLQRAAPPVLRGRMQGL